MNFYKTIGRILEGISGQIYKICKRKKMKKKISALNNRKYLVSNFLLF